MQVVVKVGPGPLLQFKYNLLFNNMICKYTSGGTSTELDSKKGSQPGAAPTGFALYPLHFALCTHPSPRRHSHKAPPCDQLNTRDEEDRINNPIKPRFWKSCVQKYAQLHAHVTQWCKNQDRGQVLESQQIHPNVRNQLDLIDRREKMTVVPTKI